MEEGKKKAKVYIKFELGILTPDFLYVWGEGTYQIKDTVLKPLGFRWDPSSKKWYIRITTLQEEEEAKKKIEELEKHVELHWIGKPLIKHESIIKNIISKLTQDKEYIVYDMTEVNWKEIIEDAADEGWREKYIEYGYDMFVSPDKKHYILTDDVSDRMYVIRDEEGKIRELMDAVDNFIHETVPKELGMKETAVEFRPNEMGVKLPAISKIKTDVINYRVEYEDIDKVRGDHLTVTFKFDNFEKAINVNIEEREEVVSEAKEIANIKHVAILDMKEISSLIEEFVAKNYKKV